MWQYYGPNGYKKLALKDREWTCPICRTHHIRDWNAAVHPDFISVTYGAGGSTSKRTVEIASKIQDTYGIPAMAHLTCVSSTKEEVVTMLDRI